MKSLIYKTPMESEEDLLLLARVMAAADVGLESRSSKEATLPWMRSDKEK